MGGSDTVGFWSADLLKRICRAYNLDVTYSTPPPPPDTPPPPNNRRGPVGGGIHPLHNIDLGQHMNACSFLRRKNTPRPKSGKCIFLRSLGNAVSTFFPPVLGSGALWIQNREKHKETNGFGRLWVEIGPRWRGGQPAGNPEKVGVYPFLRSDFEHSRVQKTIDRIIN